MEDRVLVVEKIELEREREREREREAGSEGRSSAAMPTNPPPPSPPPPPPSIRPAQPLSIPRDVISGGHGPRTRIGTSTRVTAQDLGKKGFI